MLLPINPEHPEPRKVRRAVDALERGEVIAYPTDTVYGIGCDLFNKKAIDHIYQIRHLPKTQKLTFICPDLSDIAHYAIVDNRQYRLLRRVLPGPYTFILEATREVPKIVQSKRKTVGIRVPNHPVVQALVSELGRPIITSSAVMPGGEPFIDPEEIDDAFQGLAMVLDGGAGGLEATTVVDLTSGEIEIVREGVGSIEELYG
ncbi:MAG TPA: L-threonylcarbamoyladenylate synthase [Polyangiaceae bacterium]|jgi:tRNA threonylcarbamoyl adenosine modification protein (Sua5/YciO/YrdC/YwlC family)|nr:MAG: Threonylcarbamoyl-AMP synthase [Deltaproteobacteria bacterium ADurb.Bin207]HNS98631.1 L-threonylcarbamoyladenylate synthase [Polyangiaceae bacterium]HNZ21636.1 L-threonylcarbamoyladenylate synthase [Polyangiaceae bacterium]HOD25068.1 L-threonylcarbamoyladenylate synthase [Polyangiaceae bacterium]HOE48593.1 L-threonylcarbamoyladenylate synthase [Polyangiaceae bacterium]